MKRNLVQYLGVSLRGLAMGAADVVPGVSGGTIAFITGIYEELIGSLESFNLKAIKVLRKEGIKAFWNHINGSFLVALFLGILVSIASLSKGITYLLEYHPVLLWSFFFGLILASIWLIGKSIGTWKLRTIIAMIVGTIISYYITIATPTQSPESTLFIFFAGTMAIIAMILPGISGAFILLLLGAYSTIIGLINTLRESLTANDMAAVMASGMKLGVFALGCITGLLAFSKVLSWMFKNYHDTTLALLTGFMIGSLNKVWPWKTTVMSRVAHQGKPDEAVVPFIQENVLPGNFHTLNEVEKGLSIVPVKDPQLMLSIVAAIAGLLLIVVMDRFSPKKEA